MKLADIPDPFQEALDHHEAKAVMTTSLSSADARAALSAAVRRQSLWAARTMLEGYLEKVKAAVGSIINPKTIQRPDRVTEENPAGNVTTGLNLATARAGLRQALKDEGYSPDPADAGTIKDLSSDARLELVVKTNVQLAQGAGQFVQGNANQDVVDAFPGWELLRYEDREVPRGEKRQGGALVPDPQNSWPTRFRAAAAQTGDDDALRVIESTGRMIARKDSPLWPALGDGAGGYDDTLNNPYPPFAFNSGMWTQDVSRAVCIEVGLIKAGEVVAPADFDFASLFKEAA